jgi:large subunit ribosomal protein L3
MSRLIGRKISMTSIFSENRKNIPCTVVEAGPCGAPSNHWCWQVQANTTGWMTKTSIPQKHAWVTLKSRELAKKKVGWISEFCNRTKLECLDVHYVCRRIVDVTRLSKGKRFQGVVKRHGFGEVLVQTTHRLTYNRLRAGSGKLYPSKSIQRECVWLEMGGGEKM